MPIRTVVVLFLVALMPVIAIAQQPPGGVAPTPKLTPEDEKARIELPPGFELQLVASDPDIRKPMNICFDARGRIWMTDTIEYPFPAKDRPGRDRILILDDFGPDGRARKITVFAEGLNIPIGIIPYEDGCIAWSIPNLWRFRDTDGDGKADRKDVLYGPFDFVDTHGNINSLTIGFDGWLYACHGFRNDSHIRGTDGEVLHLNSGNVFRMKLDGSRVESFTRGQVNPFGLAFDPLGNLYSACCHSRPLTQLLRGAIYESFGKPHDGLGHGPHMNEFGQEHSTGLCGLVYYAADHFPKEYHGKLFMGDVVLNRINTYRIERTGSSPRAIHERFLVSNDPWFRPVDQRLGPDGAIYLADFYNRIIGHYEVPLTHPGRDRDSGRLWRIVWKGADGKAVPPTRPYDDLTRESPVRLVELLAHANLTVRMHAMHELARRGTAVVEPVRGALQSPASTTKRIHAMWVMERIGALDDAVLATLLASDAEDLAIHVARLLAERKTITADQRHWLQRGTASRNSLLGRVTADALGRHPSADSINPLIALTEAGRKVGDHHLVHVARMALRDQIKAGIVWSLAPADRGAIKNMDAILDVLPGAPSPEAAAFLLDQMATRITPPQVEFVARHGRPETAEKLVVAARDSGGVGEQLAAFQAMRRGVQARGMALSKSAHTWAVDLAGILLQSSDPARVEAGAELAGSTGQLARRDELLALARDGKRPTGPRAAAYAALLALEPAAHIATLGDAIRDGSAPADLRERVARSLGALNRSEARHELVESFTRVPAALATQIALGLAATRPGAEELLTAITKGKASPRLLLERPVQTLIRQHNLPDVGNRLAKLTAGLPPIDEKMNQLIRARLDGYQKRPGNAIEGQKVYAKHCAACHQIGGQGAKVGPQLDGIGARSAERLLEDMLDPNRNVDPAFRASRLTLRDGRDLQGLVLREEGEVVVMADNQGKEQRIEKSQIEERAISPLSPMPANWGDTIPPAEMNDLLAYLLGQRPR